MAYGIERSEPLAISIKQKWAASSLVERYTDNVEVHGPIPWLPTQRLKFKTSPRVHLIFEAKIVRHHCYLRNEQANMIKVRT